MYNVQWAHKSVQQEDDDIQAIALLKICLYRNTSIHNQHFTRTKTIILLWLFIFWVKFWSWYGSDIFCSGFSLICQCSGIILVQCFLCYSSLLRSGMVPIGYNGSGSGKVMIKVLVKISWFKDRLTKGGIVYVYGI